MKKTKKQAGGTVKDTADTGARERIRKAMLEKSTDKKVGPMHEKVSRILKGRGYKSGGKIKKALGGSVTPIRTSVSNVGNTSIGKAVGTGSVARSSTVVPNRVTAGVGRSDRSADQRKADYERLKLDRLGTGISENKRPMLPTTKPEYDRLVSNRAGGAKNGGKVKRKSGGKLK